MQIDHVQTYVTHLIITQAFNYDALLSLPAKKNLLFDT